MSDYTCAHCGGVFARTWTDEESLAQTKDDFGIDVRPDDAAVICDDCYNAMTAWWNALPEGERSRMARECGYGEKP
jgi:hypothetical protein